MKEKLSNRSRARQHQSSGEHLAARGTPESEVCVALQRLRHGHVEAEQPGIQNEFCQKGREAG